MFLQYGSYAKHPLSKQQVINNQNKKNGQVWDEFAFSDFFIRKHPKNSEFPVSKNLQDDIQRNKKQRHEGEWISQNDGDGGKQQKCKEMNIFCLPNKKAFQIKFLQSKNKKYDQLQSVSKKQDSQKFKNKRDLILSRKNNPNQIYTPRSSTKYSNQNNRYLNKTARYSNEFIQDQESRSSSKMPYKRQRKSIEIYTNLAQSPNLFQSAEMSLTNAYKVKSLVLGKNPKEQHLQKSKEVIGGIYDKKYGSKKINSSRTKSQKLSLKKIEGSFGQTSRISTEYRRDNLNIDKLPSGVKEKNRKSVKLNSIFQKLEGQFHGEEISLEPWTKDINLQPWSKGMEMDDFHDVVQEPESNFKDTQPNSLEFQDLELANIESKPGSRRNCFRKIYSTKENIKLKSTIFSQK